MMRSPCEVVSGHCRRQASVLTQVDCQHNSVIARLAVSKLVHTHTRIETLQIHSDLQYKYTHARRRTDRCCISFIFSIARGHKQTRLVMGTLGQLTDPSAHTQCSWPHWQLGVCITWRTDCCSLSHLPQLQTKIQKLLNYQRFPFWPFKYNRSLPTNKCCSSGKRQHGNDCSSDGVQIKWEQKHPASVNMQLQELLSRKSWPSISNIPICWNNYLQVMSSIP